MKVNDVIVLKRESNIYGVITQINDDDTVGIKWNKLSVETTEPISVIKVVKSVS